MKLSAIALLLLLTCCTQVFSQESSRDDFREFCKLVEGRWVADITWVADWPGVGNKGEKATGYFDVKLDADGHALVGRHYAGRVQLETCGLHSNPHSLKRQPVVV